VPPLLELRDVRARYGPVPALQGVALRVDEGEIVAVLGANGAGKTTTLRAISGTVALEAAHRAYVLEAGRVALEGASSELRENESVRRSYLGY
jgi:ABC-type branched-subunit amino acid transport system ATPase component